MVRRTNEQTVLMFYTSVCGLFVPTPIISTCTEPHT